MRAFYRLERSSRKAGNAAQIAFVIFALCAPEILHVAPARAQSDIAFGPIEDAGTILSAAGLGAGLNHPSLASWFRDPVGTTVGWILGTPEDAGPQVIPASVVLRTIPGHGSYRYAVIGGQRFVVDATTRAVVYIVD